MLLVRRKDIGKSLAFESSAASAIMAGRGAARVLARNVVAADVAALVATTDGLATLAHVAIQDAGRAVQAARSLAERSAKLLRSGLSNSETRAAIKPALERVAVTEAAHAYNLEREGLARAATVGSIVRIFKVWDATLDKRTCPTCSGLDGMIVGIGEAFPVSQPAHPRCRCTFTMLRADEVNGDMAIRAIGR